jgi:Cell Wall Hydrolase
MVASRVRVMSASYPARFWLSACCLALMPTSIGYQDLAALIARQPGTSVQWREHLIASPFGTIEAATFSHTRPTGTAMPEPLGLFQNVNFDPRSLDAYAWKIDEPITARPARQVEYPSVNRDHKGDRLPASSITPAPADLPQLQPISAPTAPLVTPPVAPSAKTEQRADEPTLAPPAAQMDVHNDAAAAPAPPVGEAAAAVQLGPVAPPLSDTAQGAAADDDVLADKPPEIPGPGEADANGAPSSLDELSFLDEASGDRSAQVYFGGGVMGSPASLQRWAPGAEPILVPPADSDIKLSALEGADTDTGAGETIAGKDNSRLESPADRLGLAGKPRVQAEKCLADAVYFEARGEVVKGQQAVAQVVMNRVFSGYYPHDVCGVVYQNAGRHLACQFTFACEGKDLSRIDEPDMWEQAKQIAKDTLDGKIWLAEVGHATHYHAYWVHPSWVHEMAKLYHLGVHTFYRPRNWGDGDDAPVWGPAPATSKADTPADKFEAVRLNPEVSSENPEPAIKSPEMAAKGSQALAAPERAATAKIAATAKL